MALKDRLQHAWSAFRNRDPTDIPAFGPSFTYRPNTPRINNGGERTLLTSVVNRIAMDACQIDIQHVKLDDENRYIGSINSDLNYCLNIEANIDQTGRELIHDAVFSMLDEGVVALVPVVTDFDPRKQDSYKIKELRVGKITQWYPRDVKVSLYDDRKGEKRELIFPKKMVAIITNPFYSVMNAPNSTLKRLIRKLALLDLVDEQTSSGNLNMIVQLPYAVKTDLKRQEAEKRRKDLEVQLSSNNKYGVAYVDATEKITQINRPLENTLLKQIEYLQGVFYAELGISEDIMNGKANESEMLNYNNRVIEPIVAAIVEEMKRKFLTKTARTQKQSIEYFREPFKLVPISNLADIADRFTRNEIMTSNEFRQVIGMRPSTDPRADELRNKNIADVNEYTPEQEQEAPMTQEEYDQQMSQLDEIDKSLDDLEGMVNE